MSTSSSNQHPPAAKEVPLLSWGPAASTWPKLQTAFENFVVKGDHRAHCPLLATLSAEQMATMFSELEIEKQLRYYAATNGCINFDLRRELQSELARQLQSDIETVVGAGLQRPVRMAQFKTARVNFYDGTMSQIIGTHRDGSPKWWSRELDFDNPEREAVCNSLVLRSAPAQLTMRYKLSAAEVSALRLPPLQCTEDGRTMTFAVGLGAGDGYFHGAKMHGAAGCRMTHESHVPMPLSAADVPAGTRALHTLVVLRFPPQWCPAPEEEAAIFARMRAATERLLAGRGVAAMGAAQHFHIPAEQWSRIQAKCSIGAPSKMGLEEALTTSSSSKFRAYMEQMRRALEGAPQAVVDRLRAAVQAAMRKEVETFGTLPGRFECGFPESSWGHWGVTVGECDGGSGAAACASATAPARVREASTARKLPLVREVSAPVVSAMRQPPLTRKLSAPAA